MHVHFLHLDLGVGGAERLVVDAACALKLRGHSVLLLTSHHDPNHAFEETMISADGLISQDIRCAGDWLPRHACGKRFHLFFAILRTIYTCRQFASTVPPPDVYIIDQVSFAIPFARWFLPRGTPILFYLHFPDKLLVQDKRGWARRAYRFVFDWLEEYTTCQADRIVTNSYYTLGVVQQAFPSLGALLDRATNNSKVLYPCVDLEQFDRAQVERPSPEFAKLLLALGDNFCLSINRFERKKNIQLVVEAFALVHEQHPGARLVITGGYDDRVEENVLYCQQLQRLVRDELGLGQVVHFWVNCSEGEKRALLGRCRVLVYTPAGEHFGIVPIEAGAARKPCICCNSGGPLESIVDGETGMLCEPTALEFAHAMEAFVGPSGLERSTTVGRQARARVEDLFSRTSFGENLERICEEMRLGHRAAPRPARVWLWLALLLAGVAAFVHVS